MLESILIGSKSYREDRKGLTRSLEESLKLGKPIKLLPQLLEHAKRNKMLLHLLRKLNVKGQIRSMEEAKYAKTLEAIANVAENLNGLEYTLFKVFKPVAYVPADIDVLISSKDLKIAIRRLNKLGLRAIVKDSYCLTLNGEFIVDLYTYPNFANIIYLDARELMNYVTENKINGVAIRTLTNSAEVVVVLAHALYKEQIYTLNDKITIQTWLDGESEAIFEELKAKKALELAQKINRQIDDGLIETPYKIPMTKALTLMACKALQDPLTRATIPKLLARLMDKRLTTQIVSRIRRVTY
ncbi:MAG: hypothetical protein QXP55_03055 [Nitrososphaerales archaeon]